MRLGLRGQVPLLLASPQMPLLYAVQKAYPQIVDFLIRNGARITDCGDYDAYDLALELKHFSCADVIEKILLSSYSL